MVENEADPKRVKSHSENSKLHPSKRHMKDLDEFKSFKRKPIREEWVLEGTMVY